MYVLQVLLLLKVGRVAPWRHRGAASVSSRGWTVPRKEGSEARASDLLESALVKSRKLLLWRKDVDLVADSVCSGTSLLLWHLHTNDDGVPGFGIDAGGDRLAAARYC